MSARMKTAPEAAPGSVAGTSIDRLTFLLGIGAIVATVAGSSCSNHARFNDLQAQMAGIRTEMASIRTEMASMRTELHARIDDLEKTTAASFASVRQQLGAVALCLSEIRYVLGAAEPDRDRVAATCDRAVRVIVTPDPDSP